MDAWNVIINASTKELYADAVLQFRNVCVKYPDLLKYVESTILDQVKEKVVCAWTDQVMHLGNTTTNRVESAHACLKNWLGNSKGDLITGWESVNQMLLNQHNKIHTTFGRSITVLEHRFKDNTLYSQLVGNVSRAALNYIFYEAKRASNVGSDSSKCGCTIVKTYGLPCACVISKKMKVDSPIGMDEVSGHWKRLSFDDDGKMKSNKSNISILTEWEAIQERFLKADDATKLHIKEQLRKIAFPETTNLKPPSQPVKTKGAPKKVKPTPSDNSTTRSPSYFEHVDKIFPDSPTPKSQKSAFKGARISKPPPTPTSPKIPFIDHIPVFMHKYIERIVNVGGDGNCGF